MKNGVFFLIAATFVGCSSSERGQVRTGTRELDQHNGQKLNGIFIDSIKIGSTEAGIIKLLKVSYTDLADDSGPISGTLSLDTTVLSLGSTELSQAGTVYLNGITIQGQDEAPLPLRIESATNAASPNGEVKLYTVSFAGGKGGAYFPLCDEAATSPPTPAIAMAGYWNLDEGTTGNGGFISSSAYFSFACVDSAVAKCVLAGYKPWASVTADGGTTNLANHHQACTRMIRADYCGDGVTWTANGIMIDLWDGLGIQTDTDTGWNFEAVWTPDGAYCLDSMRHYNTATPGCVSSCGSSPTFSSTRLLMDRFETQQ